MDNVLVTGGTGRLGAIAASLLGRGHSVRAMTRDPGSAAARALAEAGAELVAGDFDDREGLAGAFRGSETVIAAGTAHRAGPDGEARHGVNVADAVSAARVSQLVYISGAGAERPTGVPVFDSKNRVERHIRSLGIAYTIVAPVYFMENAFNPWNLPSLQAGRFALPLPADRPLRQVPVQDIASFVAHVVEHREAFVGRRVAIAADELTGGDAAEILSRVTRRRFEFERVSVETLNPAMRRLFEWLDAFGEEADIADLRSRYPEVGWHSFEQWASGQAWP